MDKIFPILSPAAKAALERDTARRVIDAWHRHKDTVDIARLIKIPEAEAEDIVHEYIMSRRRLCTTQS